MNVKHVWILTWMFNIVEFFFLLLNRCYNICTSTTKGEYYANTIIATWGYFSFLDVITSNVSLPSKMMKTNSKAPKTLLLLNYLRKKRLTTIHGNILQVCNNDHSNHINQSNFVSCLSYQYTWMDLRNGY